MYKLESNSKTPLHIQLYEQLKKDIISNYKIDEKLPSIRKTANTYNISKNTVEAAYSQLIIEGYIDSIPKSGYIVINTSKQNFEIKNTIQKEEKQEEILYNFFPARLEKETFPLKLWKRLLNKTLNENIDLGMYSDKKGAEKWLDFQLFKVM